LLEILLFAKPFPPIEAEPKDSVVFALLNISISILLIDDLVAGKSIVINFMFAVAINSRSVALCITTTTGTHGGDTHAIIAVHYQSIR